jgi:hypothetical protein
MAKIPEFLQKAAAAVQAAQAGTEATQEKAGSLVRSFAVQQGEQQAQSRADFVTGAAPPTQTGQEFVEKMNNVGQPEAFKRIGQEAVEPETPSFLSGGLSGSGIAKAREAGSEHPIIESLTTQNPLVQTGLGAAKGALELSVKGGNAIDEFLGIESVRDKITNPDTLAEFDRLNVEFEDTLKREGFNQKAGKTLFDIGLIVAGGAAARAGLGALGVGGEALLGAPAMLAAESIGGTTAASLAINNEAPTTKELGLGYLLDVGLTKLLRVPVRTTQVADWAKNLFKAEGDDMTRAGLSMPEANVIKDIPLELQGFAKKALAQAKKRSEKIFEFGVDGGKVKTATDLVADDVKVTQDAMAGFLKTTGEEIGVVSDSLKGKGVVSTQSAMESFIADLDELNVTVSLDKVVSSGSDVSGLAADEALLQDAYDFLKSNGQVNPRNLLSKIRNYGNKLYAGKGEITASKRPIQALRENLMKALETADEAYAPLAKQYSLLMDATDTLNSTVRESGENAAQYMRRLFNRASGKAESVVELIEDVAKEFNIPAGQDISGKAVIATTLDDLSGATPPQGFQGQIAQAGEAMVKKGPIRGGVETALNKITEVLFDSPSKLEAVAAFMRQMDSPTAKSLSAMDKLINLTTDPASKELLTAVRAAMQESLSVDNK